MIETAYAALASLIATTLVQADFLPSPDDLRVDPPETFAPSGDEMEVVRAAALVKVKTGVVRTMMGGPGARYVVERECRLELAAAGPAAELRRALLAWTLGGLAVLPANHPTLNGAAERLVLTEQTDDELPPNGEAVFVTFTIRVRAGDPLGLTA